MVCEHGAARLGKLGVDLRRVAADAQHLGLALELRVVVAELAGLLGAPWRGRLQGPRA